MQEYKQSFITYENNLKKTGEVGEVEEVIHTIIRASGIPSARLNEIIVFENNERGFVLSLLESGVEILLLARDSVKVGDKLTRTDEFLEIEVGEELLGMHIDPLGVADGTKTSFKKPVKKRVDISPPDILGRKTISQPLETGVRLVDLVVPLGRGQRQLIIGDRKTGKTDFLQQVVVTQAKRGTICIYAGMGRRASDIERTIEHFKKQGVMGNVIVVSTNAPDAAGLIFVTPYAGMAIAEYFRDLGRDVLIILDDMTNHAKYYREISLLSGRFPGRNSYPGDIFYRHARLIERAGNFEKGSITCLPVAESILGDLSGYIQTNLMAMTDGHLFFDTDFYNQGRRPAINPFLSVTRVGQQAQTPLVRDLSRVVATFLVHYQKMQEFVHFGAELTDAARQTLLMGDQAAVFFDQLPGETMEINVSVILTGFLWSGMWRDASNFDIKKYMQKFASYYLVNPEYKNTIDQMITAASTFSELVGNIKQNRDTLSAFLEG